MTEAGGDYYDVLEVGEGFNAGQPDVSGHEWVRGW
jgi:serine phosphatase RsbU (regulator of sigma subunit)